MADIQNDTDGNENEYEFADLDVGGSDLLDDDDYVAVNETPVYEDVQPKNTIVRNVIIVLVLLVFSILFYKFFSSFPGKKTTVKTQTVVQKTVPPPVSQVVPAPTVISTPVIKPQVNNNDEEVNRKLAALDATQQNLSAEVSTINSQLNTISANMNALNAKMASLNDSLTILASRLEEQDAHLTAMIEARKKVQVEARPRAPRIYAPAVTYYLQAIIPGRAWLIASNGSTITVREGTNIAGYGTVKMIDPSQGRVLLSSGRIIRFSQQDS